jgi:drug/metabolite transporter (DMT)-like permease
MDDSPGMRAEDPKVSRVIYADGKTMLTLIELHDPEPPPMHTWWHLLKGILIMKLSVLLLTVSGILVKYHYEFNPLVSVYDLVFVRAFAQLCVALFIAVKDNANLVDLTDHQWKLVFVRSVSGTMTFFIFNAAVKLISLSKVAFLGNTSPIFATIIAFLFLGESLAR